MSTQSMHISPAQAAQMVGVSRWTIVRALKNQQIQGFRDNRNHWKVSKESVQEWASAHLNENTEDVPSTPETADYKALAQVAALETEIRLLKEQLERDRAHAAERINDLINRAERAEKQEEITGQRLDKLLERTRRRWWQF